jgi:hypothetical protein
MLPSIMPDQSFLKLQNKSHEVARQDDDGMHLVALAPQRVQQLR